MTEPAVIAMYQGVDWSQQISFFEDEAQTIPLVFDHPVMDVRSNPTTRLATFDDTGDQEGLAAVTAPGVLTLSMGFEQTALVKAGTYDIDIFADVGPRRDAITKVGTLQLRVDPRMTRDTGP